MPTTIASILKILGVIVPSAVEAAGTFAGMRTSTANLKSDERIRALEEEMVRLAELTAGLAKQTQAIAEELRAQDAVNAAQEKKLKLCLVLSVAASCVAVSTVVVALLR